jgi:hypothetical protein
MTGNQAAISCKISREFKYGRLGCFDSVDTILRGMGISFDKQFGNLYTCLGPGRILLYNLNGDLAQDFREFWREILDAVMNFRFKQEPVPVYSAPHHTHLTRNYICSHIYKVFIITTHYCIVFYHFNNS